MDKKLNDLKRKLNYTIINRLKTLGKRIDSPNFLEYKKLWKERLKSLPRKKSHRTGLFNMVEQLVQELTNEIQRVKSLPRKKFKMEFGKKTYWNLKIDKIEKSGKSVLDDSRVRQYLYTKFHEFKSKGL
jgi:hypothetical protein